MKARPNKNREGVVLEVNRRDESLMAEAESTRPSPFRLKHVLVPIDFSDCSRKALRYAIPFAREHGAAITLLYVVPAGSSLGEYGGLEYAAVQDDLRDSGGKQLVELATTEVGKTVPVDTQVRTGSPTREILQAARELPADLIVVSTHGRTGLQHVFLGSVAEHVVRRAPCPVLVVREREHEFVVPS